MQKLTYCGFVAIIGRPNVGKSSLLNSILRKKVSITCFRPQTTRHQILGIKTEGDKQTVYVDTPGIHLGKQSQLNRQMNKVAHQSLIDVNAVIFVVEALKWTSEDEHVCQHLNKTEFPIIVALNKIDLVTDREALLAFMQKIADKLPRAEIVPISVRKRTQIDTIERLVTDLLPESVFYFPEEQSVNQSEQFYLSEIIREKLMRLLEQEIPYSTCVQIEKLEHQDNIVHIHGLIWVERDGQKGIVIGDKGAMLREIGTLARIDLEKYYNKKVCLKLWVKVKENWSDNEQALQTLCYSEY